MADVFISYASEDREEAGRLAGALESAGWSVWWDRDIVAGQIFDEIIERELGAARIVVVLWSGHSISSEWVKNEAATAAERNALVPVRIENVKLPLEFRRRQTVDLIGWDGDPLKEDFTTLCKNITANMGGSATPPVTHDGSLKNRQTCNSEDSSTNPKPVITPTLTLIVVLIILFLLAGLALLQWGTTRQQTVGAFFCFALVGAIVTYGLLGATGMARTRGWKVGGAAGVLVVILVILLPFAGDQTHEIKGTVYLDDRPVTKATVALLESDRADNSKEIGPNENGRFAFTLSERKKAYKFVVKIPDLGETAPMAVAPSGDWLELRVRSADLKKVAEDEMIRHLETCMAETGSCTLFLYNFYGHDQISADEFKAFQNFQTHRLDTGIRNYLQERNLLNDTVKINVKRCTELSVEDEYTAGKVTSITKAPVILWGYLQRSGDHLTSVTTATFQEPEPLNYYMKEQLGNDVTTLLALDKPLSGGPLTVATFVLGNDYLKRGQTDLARRAFLDARELLDKLDTPPSPDFVHALDAKLKEVQSANPAADLSPL